MDLPALWNNLAPFQQTFGSEVEWVNHVWIFSDLVDNPLWEGYESEILGSKYLIENKIGEQINFFSYPGGGYNKQAIELVKTNFTGGLKDRIDGNDDLDPMKLARLSIDNKITNIKEFLIKLKFTLFLG